MAEYVAAQILRDATTYSFAVPAYVFMKNHTHWLVEGLRNDSALGPFIKTAKQRTGYWFRQRSGRALWSSYFDMIIRDDVQMWEVVRYIVNNPVRAGLVASPADYPLWGSATASRQEILDHLARRPVRSRRPLESTTATL